MAFRVMVACTATAFVGVSGVAPVARADSAPSSFTNSATVASGRTPSGVTVTVRKQMIGTARVTSAEASPANPAAPDDEYLIPANSKTSAGFVDLYEGFEAEDGKWSDVAQLTFTFSRPVRDPRLHVFGTGGASGESRKRRDDYWPAVELVGGVPARPTFSWAAGFPGYRVTSDAINPERVYSTRSTTCGVVYTCGTVKVNGTVSAFTVRLKAHDVRHGSGGSVSQMWAAFKLSLAEDVSDAPASYGVASHALTDSHLGWSVSEDHTDEVSMTPRAVALDTGDDAMEAGEENSVISGGRCRISVPVTAGSPSKVAGWIDFDRDGRFDADERATTTVDEGASSAELTWRLPESLPNGPVWMRLRMVARAESVTSPTGWADSGEVEDHQIQFVE
ncbi:hypothetical protein FE391_24570 [Nonomuraea sp. KC401]|uniref:GEVED domain-containing protein n=1 Tax=unclassified Nonomuraea TaxID=2593643 RepID=UPI0010FE4459|nr:MULTISPECIES: GEVED domain-containing protein [unclassified Nonomuraea]NBE95422.1 hypothetical protein [Nonomuraea sp. K271]TLF66375.1 hypothetical protein FE391_24570 [Nonomuraea sp. KC401]